ncbi:MAG: hypothetical protein LPD71_00175 [Shewanella sp.]|nr:hypothetical protein [Shewanella sp.]MCF1457212.1 hypothetical protein [Shewanella sp.]
MIEDTTLKKTPFYRNPLIAIVLMVINLGIIGPGTWLINKYWDETIKFRDQTESELQAIKEALHDFQNEVSAQYVQKEQYRADQREQAEWYRHLDNKILLSD